MGIILFSIIVLLMSVTTYLTVSKKEKPSFEGAMLGKELNSLYEYKCFLVNAREVKAQLQIKLDSVNYNNLPYETFFRPFEIAILKNEINTGIAELEDIILNPSISAGDFTLKTDQIRKRIDMLCLPLTAIQHNLGDDYYDMGIVA